MDIFPFVECVLGFIPENNNTLHCIIPNTNFTFLFYFWLQYLNISYFLWGPLWWSCLKSLFVWQTIVSPVLLLVICYVYLVMFWISVWNACCNVVKYCAAWYALPQHILNYGLPIGLQINMHLTWKLSRRRIQYPRIVLCVCSYSLLWYIILWYIIIYCIIVIPRSNVLGGYYGLVVVTPRPRASSADIYLWTR